MKNEQVIPNYKVMLETSFTLLALVASGWLLIKLISACFWLPGFLKNWQFEEAKQSFEKQLKEKEENEEKEKTKDVEETTSEEKEDLVKPTESEVDDDATKKNK